ncbi:MAG: hypothetical protein COV45_07555 [Deltaproteobacteria bacterium CG11_big_fil_rev_8_21_14_0_20_47_16]|nr:MAG: hypothetical protein COV45_07555 [Deltaproteobacteria bacterium CG11_big_fil_rev_8_21_14_0_20_47_16]
MVESVQSHRLSYVVGNSFGGNLSGAEDILDSAVGEATCLLGMCWNRHTADEARKVIAPLFLRVEPLFPERQDAIAYVRSIIELVQEGPGISLSEALNAQEVLVRRLRSVGLASGMMTYSDYR